MLNDLITPDNLSNDFLKSILDDAYMETSLDQEGDLTVEETITCYVMLDEDDKSKIYLWTVMALQSIVERVKVLEVVNDINSKAPMIKAYITSEGEGLAFSYEICLKGGITKRNFVLMVKRFCNTAKEAAHRYAHDMLKKYS